jgi:hypothetical protein
MIPILIHGLRDTQAYYRQMRLSSSVMLRNKQRIKSETRISSDKIIKIYSMHLTGVWQNNYK